MSQHVVVQGVLLAVAGEKFAGGGIVEHEEVIGSGDEIPRRDRHANRQGGNHVGEFAATIGDQDVVVVNDAHPGMGIDFEVGEKLARADGAVLTAVFADQPLACFVVDAARTAGEIVARDGAAGFTGIRTLVSRRAIQRGQGWRVPQGRRTHE